MYTDCHSILLLNRCSSDNISYVNDLYIEKNEHFGKVVNHNQTTICLTMKRINKGPIWSFVCRFIICTHTNFQTYFSILNSIHFLLFHTLWDICSHWFFFSLANITRNVWCWIEPTNMYQEYTKQKKKLHVSYVFFHAMPLS